MISRLLHERLGRLAKSRMFSKLLWRDMSDEYTRTLDLVVGGWLNPGNLLCFDHAIGNLPSASPIVEIGSFCGLSANLMSYYKGRHGVINPLICCDKWTTNVSGLTIGESWVKQDELYAFIREAFLRSTRAFSSRDLPYGIEMFSSHFFDAWQEQNVIVDLTGRPIQLGGEISFCYVDGGHDYDTVRRDFENCHRFLQKGGFILFDDSSIFSAWEGVRKLVREVKDHPDYEIIMRNPNYLFRKK